jgi:S1-C subfamily serine protease
MADDVDWSFPEALQPPREGLAFDLDQALDAMVALRAEVPDEAFTAGTLGTDRGGNGIVIGADGTILTIGYLITEARSVWITTQRGAVLPAYPLAYDQATGFGLVRALGRLDAAVLPRGRAQDSAPGDRVYVIGHGGRRHALQARLAARREFAGYWEYLLEQALFTTPAHPEWSGAAVLDAQGRLIGVGSLLTEEGSGEARAQANMAVPIDLLEPILGSLLETGRSGLPARPWLGLYAGTADGQLVVGGTAQGGPAERAGVRQADLILEVAGRRVASLPEFLRAGWALGPAGTRVPLALGRDGDLVRPVIGSVDRNDVLLRPRLH